MPFLLDHDGCIVETSISRSTMKCQAPFFTANSTHNQHATRPLQQSLNQGPRFFPSAQERSTQNFGLACLQNKSYTTIQSVHICPWNIVSQNHIASGRNIKKIKI